MKVVVLGAGVIGVTAAYELAGAGHEVVVVDRQAAPALETSFANAGEVSPGYSAPWAGPGVPLKAIKWLVMHHRPLVIRPNIDWALVRWVLAMLRNCTAARYEVNKARMVRLAEYSRDCLRALRAATGIAYDERMQGTLQLFRTQKQLDGSADDIAVLRRSGVAFELLDRAGCIRHEPALARVQREVRRRPAAARRRDRRLLQVHAAPGRARGGSAASNSASARPSTRSAAQTASGSPAVDTDSRPGRRRRLPGRARQLLAAAARGRSASASRSIRSRATRSRVPITDPAGAPESTVMDETHKVAVTRLGDRIRVGGTAELAGYTLKLHEARRKTLGHVVGDLFPGGGDLARAEFWCGLRPMTPDGTPIIGATPIANLYLATGHGTLGWTMAAGTGRIMADLISGRSAGIDLAGLTIARYGGAVASR